MKPALTNLGQHVRRRIGLTWVLAVSALTVLMSFAGPPAGVRLPIVLAFFLTVPGFLILDLRQPTDVAAKAAMGIASSVSFYVVVVSIVLLGAISWIAAVVAVFLGGFLGVAVRPTEDQVSSRSRRTEGSSADGYDLSASHPGVPDGSDS